MSTYVDLLFLVALIIVALLMLRPLIDAVRGVSEAIEVQTEDLRSLRLLALSNIADAIARQTEEFRALRVALCGGDQRTFRVDVPGLVTYPFCDACGCPHHPENDHCVLRGGRGVAMAAAQQQPAETPDQNASDAAAVMANIGNIEEPQS